MSSRPPRQNLPKEVAESFDPPDHDILEQFCAGIEIDDISFEKWRDLHQDLDLIYTLYLNEDEISQGCEKIITYTRSIKTSSEQQQRPVKVKVEKSIKIEPNAKHGQVIVVEGQGDVVGEAVGDLRVLIHIN